MGHTGRGWHLLGMTGLAQDAVLPSTVGLAAAGDEAAFARIAGAYHDDMLRVACVIANDWDLAEDAVQAALWKAWRKLPSLRDPERIRPWLVSVAANEARQIIRHRHRGGVVEIEVAPETGSQPDPSADIGRLDLANALRRLKPEERALLALRYVADLDSAEIGAQSGMSASGVRSRLSRLLEQLRRELDDD
jgi:RNA polymerase sigma-70 factor (ECF subfamily)